MFHRMPGLTSSRTACNLPSLETLSNWKTRNHLILHKVSHLSCNRKVAKLRCKSVEWFLNFEKKFGRKSRRIWKREMRAGSLVDLRRGFKFLNLKRISFSPAFQRVAYKWLDFIAVIFVWNLKPNFHSRLCRRRLVWNEFETASWSTEIQQNSASSDATIFHLQPTFSIR